MMKNLAIFILLTTIATMVACSSDSDNTSTTSSSAVVTYFSLAADDSVLENLDSIYFSVDLVNALIYNADSLPYGTKTDKLIANIGILSCSTAELYVPRVNQSDTTINYLTNSTDSIDFSNGIVTLHLVSIDGQLARDYSISVNVHQMVPDSLYWNELARQKLPSIFAEPTEQKTVEYNNQAFCLTRLDTNYCLATSSDPGDGEWENTQVYFQFTPDVNSFAATSNALYILDTQGTLYTSTDGSSWNSCDVTWSYIYGGYGNTLLGVEYESGNYYHVTYPSSTRTLVDDECPISGTSQLVTFENIWSVTPQAVMSGGKLSDGNLSGNTWGYDGTTWAKISNAPFTAKEKMTLFPYFSYKTDTDNWTVTKYTTLVALGGMDAMPEVHKDVYISLDQGIHWSLADDLMQLPDYIPAMANTQALIFSTTLQTRSSSASSGWESFASKNLPRWWIIEEPSTSSTRATTPITEWDCPYIYLFGGTDSEGSLYNTLWRGVINRLSFKPIQ